MKPLVMVGIGAIIGACGGAMQAQPEVTEGTLEDVGAYIQRLLDADPVSNPMLVIEVTGSVDRFVQFSMAGDSVEMDHPLITEQQRGRENKITEVLLEVDCTPKVNVGSDGARFLDCVLPRSADRVLEVTEAVLQSGLGVNEEDRLTFTAVAM